MIGVHLVGSVNFEDAETTIRTAAEARLNTYISTQRRLGRDIRQSAIYAALHVEGVQRVELASPLADVVLDKTQAASCTEWSVTNGGTDE